MFPILIKIGALLLNIVLIIFHSIEYVLTIPFTNHRKLHGLCIRTSCTIIRNWFHKKGDMWRFHHRDYAIASMLLPGRLMQFGKWMFFDDFVCYDSQRLFGRRDDYVFVFDVNGNIVHNKMPTEHYLPDGSNIILEGERDGIIGYISRSRGVIDESGNAPQVHPSDTYFINNMSIIAKEILYLKKPRHLEIIRDVNHILIDAIKGIKPEVAADLELLRMKL